MNIIKIRFFFFNLRELPPALANEITWAVNARSVAHKGVKSDLKKKVSWPFEYKVK